MEDMIGEEEEDMIGADELEEMLAEYGIEGDELVGAVRRRGRRRSRRLSDRTVIPTSNRGRPRNFPFGLTEGQAIADNATATLTGTADRPCLVTSFFAELNDAAGAIVAGGLLTTITVNGRNARIGTGSLPVRSALGDFAQVSSANGQWDLGVMANGGALSIGLLNRSGAAADVYGGFRALATD